MRGNAVEVVDLVLDLTRFDSSIARALNDDEPLWNVGDYLLADIWSSNTGQPHPARPKPRARRAREHDPRFLAARERARERARVRREMIAAGEIV